MPNAVTFGLGLVSYVSISVQIRLEEQYLAQKQGEPYLVYKGVVNRWMGRHRSKEGGI